MDRKHIDDQHIVARYLADQLSDSEREAFEAFCAKNPEMFRELEATARFKGGLARLAESGELTNVVARQPGFGSFVMRHAASLAAVGVGVAVLLGAVYALRVPVMGASVAEVSGRLRGALPVSEFDVLTLMRSEGATSQRFPLPSQPKALHFRVLLKSPVKPMYVATLSQADTSDPKWIASADGLRPDGNQIVDFYLNSAKLVPGTYLLTLAPKDSKTPGQETSFRFLLERAP